VKHVYLGRQTNKPMDTHTLIQIHGHRYRQTGTHTHADTHTHTHEHKDKHAHRHTDTDTVALISAEPQALWRSSLPLPRTVCVVCVSATWILAWLLADLH